MQKLIEIALKVRIVSDVFGVVVFILGLVLILIWFFIWSKRRNK